MKLTTEFGLLEYLRELCKLQLGYAEALEQAKSAVISAGGTTSERIEGGTHLTTLEFDGVTAECYQLYPDIDSLYFES